MGLYTGLNEWREEVYQFETTDVVLGGPEGIDNKPLKELADRTTWLRNALRGYNGLTIVNSSKVLTKTEVLLKLVMLSVSGSAVITLPELEITDDGLRISLISYSAKQLTVNSPAPIAMLSSEERTSLVVADGERLEFVWTGEKYALIDYSGNLFDVGAFDYGYRAKTNTVVADGALLLRSDYPRLYDFAQSILIDDFLWNTSPGNKGFFTSGTNSTNFRIPDLRSMFIRSLDLGAGISYGRNNQNPGGYEADEFKSHNHKIPDNLIPLRRAGEGDRGSYDQQWENYNNNHVVGNTGGAETRPKNIGLIPLIKV